jgi:hypothetical protein
LARLTPTFTKNPARQCLQKLFGDQANLVRWLLKLTKDGILSLLPDSSAFTLGKDISLALALPTMAILYYVSGLPNWEKNGIVDISPALLHLIFDEEEPSGEHLKEVYVEHYCPGINKFSKDALLSSADETLESNFSSKETRKLELEDDPFNLDLKSLLYSENLGKNEKFESADEELLKEMANLNLEEKVQSAGNHCGVLTTLDSQAKLFKYRKLISELRWQFRKLTDSRLLDHLKDRSPLVQYFSAASFISEKN